MKYIKQIQFLLALLVCITSSGQRVLRTDSTLHVYGGYNKVTYYETIKAKAEKRVDTPIYEILPSFRPKVIKKVKYFGYSPFYDRFFEKGREYTVIQEGPCENEGCSAYCYTIAEVESSEGHLLKGQKTFDAIVFSERKAEAKRSSWITISTDIITTRDTIIKVRTDTIKWTPKKVSKSNKGVITDTKSYVGNFSDGFTIRSHLSIGDTVTILDRVKFSCGCDLYKIRSNTDIGRGRTIVCVRHNVTSSFIEYRDISYVRPERLKLLQ